MKITPLQESEAAYDSITYENPVSYFRDAAVEAGRKLGVDAVFTGVISEYTERKGSGAGAESPATVAFSVELLTRRTERSCGRLTLPRRRDRFWITCTR
ncbi:MAG: hypothetical protein R3B51_06125 [Thermodesulfobacteriota bacterium]